jgi:myo-inositol-1(or 4)-monophosphatase
MTSSAKDQINFAVNLPPLSITSIEMQSALTPLAGHVFFDQASYQNFCEQAATLLKTSKGSEETSGPEFNRIMRSISDQHDGGFETRWGGVYVTSYQHPNVEKYLAVRAGQFLDFEKHEVKQEKLTVVEGTGLLLLRTGRNQLTSIFYLEPGFSIDIAAGMEHGIVAGSDLLIFEESVDHKGMDKDLIFLFQPAPCVEQNLSELSAGARSLFISELSRATCEYCQQISTQVAKEFEGGAIAKVKADRSIVTATDTRVEADLKAFLSKLLPEAGFLGEETEAGSISAQELTLEYYWVVDPIDGTTNFASGIPLYGISIGLMQKTADGYVPIFGTVQFPSLGLLFSLDADGAFVLDTRTNKREPLQPQQQLGSSSVFALGDTLKPSINLLADSNIRLFGCTVFDILAVARGQVTAAAVQAHPWDFVASEAIAQAAGVKCYLIDDMTERRAYSSDDFHLPPATPAWLAKAVHIYSACPPLSVQTEVNKILR